MQVWFGWTASFWVLAGWGMLVVLVAGLVLPETREDQNKRMFVQSFKLYGHMIRDPVYLSTALAMACLISVMYGFDALAPFYNQTGLDKSPIYYECLQLLLGCLWSAGNFFNRIIGPYIKVIVIIAIALAVRMPW